MEVWSPSLLENPASGQPLGESCARCSTGTVVRLSPLSHLLGGIGGVRGPAWPGCRGDRKAASSPSGLQKRPRKPRKAAGMVRSE